MVGQPCAKDTRHHDGHKQADELFDHFGASADELPAPSIGFIATPAPMPRAASIASNVSLIGANAGT